MCFWGAFGVFWGVFSGAFSRCWWELCLGGFVEFCKWLLRAAGATRALDGVGYFPPRVQRERLMVLRPWRGCYRVCCGGGALKL